MALLDKSLDRLLLEERKNIQKYLAGQIDLNIEIDKNDNYILKDMEEELTWLGKQLLRKILI